LKGDLKIESKIQKVIACKCHGWCTDAIPDGGQFLLKVPPTIMLLLIRQIMTAKIFTAAILKTATLPTIH